MSYKVAWGPVSNRADWHEQISLTEDGEIPAVTEAVLSFGKCSKVTKSLSASELSYDDETGVLSWTIAKSTMDGFSPGSYPIGCVLTIEGVQEQLFHGDLEIYDGVVP